MILRPNQVASLESGSPYAMLVDASTTLRPASINIDTSSSSATVTKLATETANTKTSQQSSSARFSAADVAGAAVGVGGSLLLALGGAIAVIFNLRRKLKRSREQNGATRDPALHKQQSLSASTPAAPGYTPFASSSSPAWDPPGVFHTPTTMTKLQHGGVQYQQGNGQFGRHEVDNSEIREMSNAREVAEMESQQHI